MLSKPLRPLHWNIVLQISVPSTQKSVFQKNISTTEEQQLLLVIFILLGCVQFPDIVMLEFCLLCTGGAILLLRHLMLLISNNAYNHEH